MKRRHSVTHAFADNFKWKVFDLQPEVRRQGRALGDFKRRPTIALNLTKPRIDLQSVPTAGANGVGVNGVCPPSWFDAIMKSAENTTWLAAATICEARLQMLLGKATARNTQWQSFFVSQNCCINRHLSCPLSGRATRGSAICRHDQVSAFQPEAESCKTRRIH